MKQFSCNLHESRKISRELQINIDYNNSKNLFNNNNTNLQRQEESKDFQSLYKESSEKNKLFEERVRKNIRNFGLDKYQHFIIELILDIGSIGHKRIIIQKILKEKDLFCYEQFGHKVLNKCIEVSKKEFTDLYSEFIKFIVDRNNKTYQFLSNDKFGNYVIQKCLEVFDNDHLCDLLYLLNSTLLIKPEQKLASLPSQSSQKDVDLCSDQYGCLIIQKLIEIYKQQSEEKMKKQVGQMIEKVINDSYRLAQRQFSNYVIQQIIENGAEEHKNLIYSNFISKQFVYLSMDKYGSNVAEKAVINANLDQKRMIWNIISINNFSSLYNMVNDQYANYVVQRIFDSSSVKEQKQMYQQLYDWNKKNKLKENGKHPFKYIDEQMNQRDYNNMNNSKFQQRFNQNRYISSNPINTQQFPLQVKQDNNYNNNQKFQVQRQNNYNSQNYTKNNEKIKQNNQNLFENNQNQRYFTNMNQGGKNRNTNQNNFYDQRNFEQYGQQNRCQPNKLQKSYPNNYINNNNPSQQCNNIPLYKQNISIQDENELKGNRKNKRCMNQPQYQNNNQNNNDQGQQYNIEQNTSFAGKRNTQIDQNCSMNKQKKFTNQNRANCNNYSSPYYNPNNHSFYLMQQNFYQYPYYQSNHGFLTYAYPIQPVGYMDPTSLLPMIDPNNLLQQNQQTQSNVPILDFLNGAHLQLQSQKQIQQDEQKQDLSENTTQSNSLNSPQKSTNKETFEEIELQNKQISEVKCSGEQI